MAKFCIYIRRRTDNFQAGYSDRKTVQNSKVFGVTTTTKKVHLGHTKTCSFRRNWELSFRYITFEILLKTSKMFGETLAIRTYSSGQKLRLRT